MGNKFAKGHRLTDEEYAAPRKANGSRVEGYRLQKGMTQKQLAEAMGIPQQNATRFESPCAVLKYETYRRLSAVLGVPWYDLVETDQKPMELDEIRNANFVWLEIKGEAPIPTLVSDRFKREEMGLLLVDSECNGNVMQYAEHGSEWRCWLQKPTRKEIDASPWEE